MGFWEDVGAATEEFTDKYTTARHFRIQRQTDRQRQELQRQELAVRESELNARLSKQQEEKEIRAQIRVLANEYNRILSTPTPGVWDFQNHTITDKAAAELIKISTQIAVLDPQVGATYGRYVDMIYQAPKQEIVKPSELEQKINVIETKIGRKLKEPEILALSGVTSKTGEPEKKTPTIDELSRAAELGGVNPLEIPAQTRLAVGLAAQHSRMPAADYRALTSQPSPITPNEPQDTVEVDINDPRLRDTTFTESPFGINVNAPATAEDEPASEDEVRQYIEEYKAGKKPLSTYRTARTYFQKALKKGYTTRRFYDTFHSRFLSPMYPDTSK